MINFNQTKNEHLADKAELHKNNIFIVFLTKLVSHYDN